VPAAGANQSLGDAVGHPQPEPAERTLEPGRLVDPDLHPGKYLLPDARHAKQNRRLHLVQVGLHVSIDSAKCT